MYHQSIGYVAFLCNFGVSFRLGTATGWDPLLEVTCFILTYFGSRHFDPFLAGKKIPESHHPNHEILIKLKTDMKRHSKIPLVC